jgi:hypothetical protein
MRKFFLTVIGSALVASSTVQIAAAAQPHRNHRSDRVSAPVNEQIRDANAEASPWAENSWSHYEGGAISAPAGRN